MSICIVYLGSDRRHKYFEYFAKTLSNMKNKNNIVLLVLTNSFDCEFYDTILKKNNLNNNLNNFIIQVIEGERNYMDKIQYSISFAEKHSIPYIMKHDNDIIMSSYLYDYMIDNLYLLNDPKNMIITPTLTNGIPSLEYFIDDFLSYNEQKEVRDEFYKFTFGDLWGADCSSLNTLNTNKWNYNLFYNSISKLSTHYKGIHPLRFSEDIHKLLNKYVIKYKNELMSKRDYILYYDNNSPYICNNIFCIKTNKYKEIIENNSLFVDNYDEVPISKQINIEKANIVFIRNAAAIHAAYNSISNEQIEEYILKEFEFILE